MSRRRLAIVVINYRTPHLVADALASLDGQLEIGRDIAIVVDACSGDGSAERIDEMIRARGWGDWARLVRSERNGGFSAGNNVGLTAVEADLYLLLNSDTIVRPGAIALLLDAAARHPRAGLLSPRLEWPDGTPQISCFRDRTPLGEFLRAARTGPLTRLLKRYEVPLSVRDEPFEPDWTSFAAVLIRREVIERIGLMDEGYFMYFEDIDFCRQARRAGWRVLHWPAARVVHLRGGSSSVKKSSAQRRRLPTYYYASRSRYFAKFYSTPGLWLANVLWLLGRSISLVRETFFGAESRICESEWADNWTNGLQPLRAAFHRERSHEKAAA